MTWQLHHGDLERFWSRVTKSDDCWTWTGKPDLEGYGRVRIGGRQIRTHRAVWFIAAGSAPSDGLYVLHHCDNRICVRPDHLFLGTHLDNVADMNAKGRGTLPPYHVGDTHPAAKLTADDVATIRHRANAGEMQRSLASEFGVSESTISAIVLARNWKCAT